MAKTLEQIPEARPDQFKPYPAYKDSGVEWLGEIPAHWEVKRLRYAAWLNPAAGETRVLPRDTEVSFVPMEAIGENGGLDLSLTRHISQVGTGYTYFRDGDVVIAKITPCFENGKGARAFGLLNGVAFGTTELHVLRAMHGVEERFLFYLTLGTAFRKLGEGEMYGAGGQKRVPESFLKDLRHPLPPGEEQRAIADFLDRETARIDALVAKKERLIQLLKEKRSALITRAVTKGLDPNVRMRATRAALFPEIPEDWQLWTLRRLIAQVKRPVLVEAESTYREIGIRSWGKGIFHKDGVRGAQLDEKSVFEIWPGDLIINIVFAWEGAVAVAADTEQGMVASHRFPTFRHANDKVNLDYLLMFLQSGQGRGLMSINSPGAAGRNRTIRLAQLLAEEIPLPPLRVQREIVSRFRTHEQILGSVEAHARRLADRLKELRSAVIGAAVTGKIDVREPPP